jgi:fimbrial isopeptide formation D2 family protein
MGLAVIGLAALSVGFSSSAQAAPAPAVSCPPTNIWANTGNPSSDQLIQYTPTGGVVSTTPLVRDYGDIAFSDDGSTLYGIDLVVPPPGNTTLYTINPSTGAETGSVVVTGPASVGHINALSALPNGQLLVGGNANNLIYSVNPATGASSVYPASFPTGFNASGDFHVLANGDILAMGYNQSAANTEVFRIHPDHTVVGIGSLPIVFGAAQSGGIIYGFAENGQILRLPATLPTAASTAPLPHSVVSTINGTYWGGTSIQDSGICNITANISYTVAKQASAARPVHPGDVVTYKITVTNTGTVAYPATAAAFTDNLAGVTDDAKYVAGSATASAGTVTVSGSTLRWIGPLAVKPAAASAVTVTYKVTVRSPGDGNRVLRNTVTPTGAGGRCTSAAACTSRVSVTVPSSAAASDASATTSTGGEVAATGPTQIWGQVGLAGALLILGTGLLIIGRGYHRARHARGR